MNEMEMTESRLAALDTELARLLEQRLQLCEADGACRAAHGLPLRPPAEQIDLAGLTAEIADRQAAEAVLFLLRDLAEWCSRYQRRRQAALRVAYCGAKGAFAQLAAGHLFPGAETVPFPSFGSAYAAAAGGSCSIAVLPLENSAAGEVGEVLDLIYSGPLRVNHTMEYPIRHCLLVNPGADPAKIGRVTSHPQALRQCSRFLQTLNAAQEFSSSTASAAAALRESGSMTEAVIASESSAEAYGLTVLRRDIQDTPDNSTRFAVLSRLPNLRKEDALRDDVHFLLLFTVQNRAGSLAQVLNILGAHGYNLFRLLSRPRKSLPWDYYFYLEAEGSIDTPDGAAMLRELRAVCADLKLAGSFLCGK